MSRISNRKSNLQTTEDDFSIELPVIDLNCASTENVGKKKEAADKPLYIKRI